MSPSPQIPETPDYREITLSEPLQQRVEAVLRQEAADFRAITEAAGLDPARSFRGKTLRNIDFGTSDLWGFDFTGADLSGSDFSRANLQGACLIGTVLSGVKGYVPDKQAMNIEKRRAALTDPEQQGLATAQRHTERAFRLLKQGRAVEALERAGIAEALIPERLPDSDPDRLAAWLVKQDALAATKRYEEAWRFAANTYDICRDAFGEEHPQTVAAAQSLARHLAGNQRFEEAISLLDSTLSVQTKVLGSSHPDQLETRYILANVLEASGKLNQAKSLREALFAECKAMYGPHHPKTIASALSLQSGKPDSEEEQVISDAQAVFHSYSASEVEDGVDVPEPEEIRSVLRDRSS